MGVKHGPSLYGEECRLRVFRDRVLRKIFGRRGGEVTGNWRKVHDEERLAEMLLVTPRLVLTANQLTDSAHTRITNCTVCCTSETDVLVPALLCI
jgi:hypothetical protein